MWNFYIIAQSVVSLFYSLGASYQGFCNMETEIFSRPVTFKATIEGIELTPEIIKVLSASIQETLTQLVYELEIRKGGQKLGRNEVTKEEYTTIQTNAKEVALETPFTVIIENAHQEPQNAQDVTAKVITERICYCNMFRQDGAHDNGCENG